MSIKEEEQANKEKPELSGDSLVKAVELTKDQQEKLKQLIDLIPKILEQIENKDYDEIFGYRINVSGVEYVDEPIRNEILLKFLVANEYDVSVTIKRIAETINWRYNFQPLSAAYNENFTKELNELGVISYFPNETTPNYKVGTWNLYGNVKNPQKLFDQFGSNENGNKKYPGTVFLRWRVGLMEKSLLFLDFTDSKNHKIVQIHDYNHVSMFGVDKNMRKSTKAIIKIFGDNYPELLSTKFFINVPSIMRWVFSFIVNIGVISEETLKKFNVLNHGDLSKFFKAENLPGEYKKGKTNFSIFDLDKADESKIPTYGKVVLERLNKSTIEDMNLSVE